MKIMDILMPSPRDECHSCGNTFFVRDLHLGELTQPIVNSYIVFVCHECAKDCSDVKLF